MEKGKVSCIIASYNTPEEFLLASVKSILNQTYENIELIIVDDGSDISVKDTLSKINDSRLIIYTNDSNYGVTYSRNRAMKIMSGEFMAVMDADDLSDRTRFQKQVDFLNEHKDIDLVSVQMAFLTTDSRKNPWIVLPRNSSEFLARLFWDNSKPFPHGPAMIRVDFLKKNEITYNERYKKALDYRLWVDCARNNGRFHIINEYLYFYRIHPGQISQKSRDLQKYYADMICLDQLDFLSLSPSEDEKMTHLYLRDSECYSSPKDTYLWMKRLIDANKQTRYCEEKAFFREVKYRYFKMCCKGIKNHHMSKYCVWLVKSASFYCIVRGIKAIYDNRIDNKRPKTLKV